MIKCVGRSDVSSVQSSPALRRSSYLVIGVSLMPPYVQKSSHMKSDGKSSSASLAEWDQGLSFQRARVSRANCSWARFWASKYLLANRVISGSPAKFAARVLMAPEFMSKPPARKSFLLLLEPRTPVDIF